MSEDKPSHEVRGIVRRELYGPELSVESQDRILLRHRSGEGYQNISAALKVPKNTVASNILNWKKFGTTKTLPSSGRPAKLSNCGRRALVRWVSKNPMVTLTEL